MASQAVEHIQRPQLQCVLEVWSRRGGLGRLKESTTEVAAAELAQYISAFILGWTVSSKTARGERGTKYKFGKGNDKAGNGCVFDVAPVISGLHSEEFAEVFGAPMDRIFSWAQEKSMDDGATTRMADVYSAFAPLKMYLDSDDSVADGLKNSQHILNSCTNLVAKYTESGSIPLPQLHQGSVSKAKGMWKMPHLDVLGSLPLVSLLCSMGIGTVRLGTDDGDYLPNKYTPKSGGVRMFIGCTGEPLHAFRPALEKIRTLIAERYKDATGNDVDIPGLVIENVACKMGCSAMDKVSRTWSSAPVTGATVAGDTSLCGGQTEGTMQVEEADMFAAGTVEVAEACDVLCLGGPGEEDSWLPAHVGMQVQVRVILAHPFMCIVPVFVPSSIRRVYDVNILCTSHWNHQSILHFVHAGEMYNYRGRRSRELVPSNDSTCTGSGGMRALLLQLGACIVLHERHGV